MKLKTVKGLIHTANNMSYTAVTIRAEKTGNLTTISLADDRLGIGLQVNYKDIKELVKRLK